MTPTEVRNDRGLLNVPEGLGAAASRSEWTPGLRTRREELRRARLPLLTGRADGVLRGAHLITCHVPGARTTGVKGNQAFSPRRRNHTDTCARALRAALLIVARTREPPGRPPGGDGQASGGASGQKNIIQQ